MKIVEVEPESKSSSIRTLMSDLGPKGLMALIGAIGLTWFLIQGNLGSGLFSGQSPGDEVVAESGLEANVIRLFDNFESLALGEVIIRTETVTETAASIFTDRGGTQREVPRSVVILYTGVMRAPHEVTQAVSALTGVDYHQIELINLATIGGN